MKEPRTSIGGLMALVAVAAVGVAGLREGTFWWGFATAGITLLVLLRATLNAWLRAPDQRPFWVGFALFGWVYLALNWGDWAGATAGSFPLPTRLALDALHPRIHPIPEYFPDRDGFVVTFKYPAPQLKPGSPPEWKGTFESYRQVGHSLAALVFAGLGGWWAWFAFARRKEREATRHGREDPN